MSLIHGVNANQLVQVAVGADGNLTLKANDDKPLYHPGGSFGEYGGSATLAAGSNNFDLTSIPTGKIYTLKSGYCEYIGTVTNVELRLRVYHGGLYYSFKSYKPVVSGTSYNFDVQIPLFAGDYLRCQVLNATLNDDAWFYVFYETMDD